VDRSHVLLAREHVCDLLKTVAISVEDDNLGIGRRIAEELTRIQDGAIDEYE
jgi:hypothetical protein